MDEPKRWSEKTRATPTAPQMIQFPLPAAERRQVSIMYCTLMMSASRDGQGHPAECQEVYGSTATPVRQ